MKITAFFIIFLLGQLIPQQSFADGTCYICYAKIPGGSWENEGMGSSSSIRLQTAEAQAIPACQEWTTAMSGKRTKCSLAFCETVATKQWGSCGEFSNGKSSICSHFWTGAGWQLSCQANVTKDDGSNGRGYFRGAPADEP